MRFLYFKIKEFYRKNAKEKLRKDSYNKDRPEEETGSRVLCPVYLWKSIGSKGIGISKMQTRIFTGG